MSTKQISRLVVLTAVIVSLVVLLVKLIQGTAGIVGSLFNTVLGIVVVLALVIIVIWTDFLQYPMDCMDKAMAPHSSTLAWRIPWTEEPGRLQSMGSLESDTTE